jgi:hypothetical protein
MSKDVRHRPDSFDSSRFLSATVRQNGSQFTGLAAVVAAVAAPDTNPMCEGWRQGLQRSRCACLRAYGLSHSALPGCRQDGDCTTTTYSFIGNARLPFTRSGRWQRLYRFEKRNAPRFHSVGKEPETDIVSIPLAELNPTGGTIVRILLKNATGGNMLTLYVDEVRLVR